MRRLERRFPSIASVADDRVAKLDALLKVTAPHGIVAETFSGRARAARPALVDGAPGLVWASGGRPRVVFDFTIADGKIVEIEMVADPQRIVRLEMSILNG